MSLENLLNFLKVFLVWSLLSIDTSVIVLGIPAVLENVQRVKAYFIGLTGALVFPVAFLLMADSLMANRTIALVGSVYLVYAAISQLMEGDPEQVESKPGLPGFWNAIGQLVASMFFLNIDNTLFLRGLNHRMNLPIWQLIPLVVASVLLMQLMAKWLVKRIPAIKMGAYVFVLIVGIALLARELGGHQITVWMEWGMMAIPPLVVGFLAVYGKFPRCKEVTDPILYWMARGLGDIKEIVDWAIEPAVAVVRLVKNHNFHR